MAKQNLIYVFLVLASAGVSFSHAGAIERPTYWGLGNDELPPLLKRYSEPVLWEGNDRGEIYRLVISPSFRNSIIIRLQKDRADKWIVTTKTRTGIFVRTRTKRVEPQVVAPLTALAQQEKFWQSPANGIFMDPDEVPDGTLRTICMDGAYWIFEARVEGRYHGTGAQICGEDDVLVPAGLKMIEMTGLDLGPVR